MELRPCKKKHYCKFCKKIDKNPVTHFIGEHGKWTVHYKCYLASLRCSAGRGGSMDNLGQVIESWEAFKNIRTALLGEYV